MRARAQGMISTWPGAHEQTKQLGKRFKRQAFDPISKPTKKVHEALGIQRSNVDAAARAIERSSSDAVADVIKRSNLYTHVRSFCVREKLAV